MVPGTTTLNFYETLFAPSYEVLGVKLPTFSLWHLTALEVIESPFITGRGNVCLGDIQAAVQICTTRWPQKPRVAPRFRDKLANFIWGRNPAFIRKHAEAFASYLHSNQIYPETWKDENGGKPLGSPQILARISALLDIGLSWDTIMNDVSPGLASWMICGINEYRGNGSGIVSDSDHAAIQRLEALNPSQEKEVTGG